MPIAFVTMWYTTSIPTGYFEMKSGATFSPITYPILYARLGSPPLTLGLAPLPDYSGRYPKGCDSAGSNIY